METFTVDRNLVEHIEGMTDEYPYCMHLRDLTDCPVPWHWHEELELGYIERGSSEIITTTGAYVVQTGEGFFVNTNVLDMKRNAVPGQQTLEVNHIFHPVFLSGHFRSRFELRYLNPVTHNRQIQVHVIRRSTDVGSRILQKMKELQALQGEVNNEFRTRSMLSSIWLLLMQDLEQNSAERGLPERQERLRAMLGYIRSHYAERVTVKDIAAAAGISEREASRCFQRDLFRSPLDYLTEVRMEAAGKLLADTDESVTEIAYRVGFSSSAYFGKVFRKALNMSPTEFRRSANRRRGQLTGFVQQA